MNKCFVPDQVNVAVEDYCNTNFSDDMIKFQECKCTESFCAVCCENEFGELHTVERDLCSKTKCETKTIGDPKNIK